MVSNSSAISWHINLIVNRSQGHNKSYIATGKHAAQENILFSKMKKKVANYVFVPIKILELPIKTKKKSLLYSE